MKIHLLFRPPENRTEDHWLKLGSFYKSRELDALVVELYVYRLLPYLVIGTLLAYMTTALALFVWISRKPQKDVGFWDVVVMPFNWQGFQEKRGRLYIEAGQEDIQNQKFQAGIMKLRIGLQKYPQDRDSRIFLAQVYYIAGLVDPAIDLMRDGIELGINDQDFLSSFYKLCFEAEAFETIVDMSDLLLVQPEIANNEDRRYFINRYKITSLIELGRHEEALDIAHRVNTDPTARRRMIDAEYLALMKAGKPVEALAFLEKWRFRMDPGNVQLQSLFVDTYIRLKDEKNLRRSIQDLINLDPSSPDLRILGMKKWHRAGNTEELEDAFTDYLLIFGWNEQNLRKVNNFVTSVREIPLIEQVLNYARKQGMEEDIILFNLFYAYLMDGRWDEASGVLDLLKGVIENFAPIDQKLIGIGESIVLLKQEHRDNLRLLLLQELRRIRASIAFYLTVSDILSQSELYDVALDTLEQGLAIFPDSRRIEAAYREATTKAVQLAESMAQQEVEEVLELGPDQYLEQLDSLLANARYEEAEDLITEIYRIGAPWLSGRGEDFEYRRLQLYFETRDRQIQSQSTSLFLNDNPDRTPELFELAMSYMNQGKTDQSRILAEEIVRNDPRNQEAKELLKQLGYSPDSANQDPTGPDQESTALQSRAKVMQTLDTLLDEADWEAAEDLIQDILRANPAWLVRNRQAFDLLHIRYYLESGNLASASSLIRIFMGSDAQSARELLNLAKTYRNQGLDTQTQFLVDQVNRKFPNMKL